MNTPSASETVGSLREKLSRLAVVDGLPRIVQLPLDQALIDAETAVAHFDVARGLSGDSPARGRLVRIALTTARRSSSGLTRYLERLVIDEHPPPGAIVTALRPIAHGFVALSREVGEPDVELSAVVEAWQRLTAVDGAGAPRPDFGPPPPDLHPDCGVRSGVDPRRVPARLFALASTGDGPEVRVEPVRWKGAPALRVRIAAFGGDPHREDSTDVRVRLLDRRTGEVRGCGLLGGLVSEPPQDLDGDGDRYFEGTVLVPAGVDVQDVLVELDTPAHDRAETFADPAELVRARRATAFLSGWRALVADVRLRGRGAQPAERLRRLVQGLAADPVPHQPLWTAGPTPTHLLRLVALGDPPLVGLLDGVPNERATAIPGDRDRGAAAVVRAVSGPGDLLAAELAAAYDRALHA